MKKQPRPSGYTAGPTVRVSIVEPGSRLDEATRALNAQQDEASREALALVEAEREKLGPTIDAAHKALSALYAWEKANESDLKLLRSLSFGGARNVVDEAVRVSAASRVEGLFNVLSYTREMLSTVEARTAALKPRDLDGPRMNVDAPGIRSYDQLPYAATATIQLETERAIRNVGHLDKILSEAQGAVTDLAAKLDKAKGRNARAADAGAVKSAGTIRDPQEIERMKDSAPGNLQTKYDNFDPISRS